MGINSRLGDPKIAYRTISARAETVDRALSFRRAFAKRRCLIPADGFYEWRKTAKPKLPFAIAMKDGHPFTFAPALEKTGKIPNLGSGCALARLSQASLMSSSRRSILVCRWFFLKQHHAVWLGETEDGNLKALLLPYPADQMRMWEISPRVNSPKNDDPSLWEPIHAEPTQTTTDTLELLRE
jgi:putative SOS response-associated peptidase YedK